MEDEDLCCVLLLEKHKAVNNLGSFNFAFRVL